MVLASLQIPTKYLFVGITLIPGAHYPAKPRCGYTPIIYWTRMDHVTRMV